MSKLIHYIWSNKLFPEEGLYTTKGEEIHVIYVGEKSCGKDNIFQNARIRINGQIWSGNVIIHDKSSDWEKEIQQFGEKAYSNIILHVIGSDNIETLRTHGESISQLCLRFPDKIAKEYDNIERLGETLPCNEAITSMSSLYMHSFMSRLMVERIEEKVRSIRILHEKCNKKWEETLFKLLIRNFGFGLQSNIFEEWAAILNMGALKKHKNNLLQIEAIFFGQAGLLEEETIPSYYRSAALNSKYYKELVREYKFLANKFNLSSIDGKSWNYGNSTPHLRIARLAILFHDEQISISSLASCNTITEIRILLKSRLHGYWHNHIQFGSTETTGNATQHNNQLDLIIINTVVPILYMYGKHRNDITLCEKAENHLHNLQGENNSIIRKWSGMGIKADCAADTQAIIQLQKAYCNKRLCCNCRFAYAYIKKELEYNERPNISN